MRSAWLLPLLLLCLAAPARASWARLPPERLVQESDLIVVGTLRDVAERTDGGRDYGQGHIVVREVIWGRVSPGDALPLRWENPSTVACPRVEHRWRAGTEGIWLLTVADGGHVEANHPNRFVETGERRQVEEALIRHPVILRAAGQTAESTGPMTFAVIYRNFSNAPRTFPGLAFADGHLRLPAASRLAVEAELGGRPRQLKSLRVTTAGALPPLEVPAGGEHRVSVNLRDLLRVGPVEGESYEVRLTVGGYAPSNSIYFFPGLPRPTAASRPAPPAPPPAAAKFFHAPLRAGGTPPHRRAMLTFVALFSLYLWLKKFRAR